MIEALEYVTVDDLVRAGACRGSVTEARDRIAPGATVASVAGLTKRLSKDSARWLKQAAGLAGNGDGGGGSGYGGGYGYGSGYGDGGGYGYGGGSGGGSGYGSGYGDGGGYGDGSGYGYGDGDGGGYG